MYMYMTVHYKHTRKHTHKHTQLLRKQLLYNGLLGSCLGRSLVDNSINHTHSHDYVFDLSTQPPDLITVTLNVSKSHDDNVICEYNLPPTK